VVFRCGCDDLSKTRCIVPGMEEDSLAGGDVLTRERRVGKKVFRRLEHSL